MRTPPGSVGRSLPSWPDPRALARPESRGHLRGGGWWARPGRVYDLYNRSGLQLLRRPRRPEAAGHNRDWRARPSPGSPRGGSSITLYQYTSPPTPKTTGAPRKETPAPGGTTPPTPGETGGSTLV